MRPIVAGLIWMLALLIGACAPGWPSPTAPASAGARATPSADLPTSSPGLRTSPVALASPRPEAREATPAPWPVRPTPVPTATLEEFWHRMRSFEYDSLLDRLKLLPPDRRDDPLFGINDALAEEDAVAPELHGAGAALDRVEIRWDQVEPAPGVFQFDRLDRLVAEAERWHLSVLAVVDGAPAWTVDRPERIGPGPPNGLGAAPFLADGAPNPANPWAVFLATLARRYGHRIAAWELWNEPNFRDYWRGTPAEYARLFAVGQAVLHQTVPGTPVLLGGMVEDDGDFLRATLQQLCPRGACAPPPFDAVAWHVYGNPRDILSLAALTRTILAPYHVRPAIWITEANVAVNDPRAPGDAVVAPAAVSLAQQAAFVVQVYALARAAGVRTVAIYRASDEDEDGHYWGLIRGDGSGRPALFAYRTAARWLSHTSFVSLTHPSPAVTQVELRGRDGEVRVLWTDDSQSSLVRVSSRARRGLLVTCTGDRSELRSAGGVFTISLPPAPPRHAQAAPLAQPVLLVTGSP